MTNGIDGYSHENSYGHRGPHQSPGGPQRPSIQTNVPPYGVLSPVSTQHGGYHSHHTTTPQSTPFVSQQNFPPFNLPPSDFSNGAASSMPQDQAQSYAPSTSAEYPEHHTQQPSDVMMLGDMGVSQTQGVFGSESIMSKSPFVALPEDFVAFLFHNDGSPLSQVARGGYAK